MPDVAFDRFYRYDDLTEILNGWAEEHPQLFRVESIGKSYEGRDIWLVTVTNFETGPDLEKPAFLVEGNIHAIEVTGCTAALHLLDKLVRGYGSDPKVTRCLDTRAFYVVPRLTVDGSEAALADTPHFVRSSLRPYPRLDEQDGLHEEDIDGDGRVLMMRMEDPNGAWKAHRDDPRLMTPRDADEGPEDGTFYRVLWEGRIENYDGVQIKVAPPFEGLDLNRNFPVEWKPEGEQFGAGPYPLSEPETRAHIEAITARPNITGYISYHTFSGVHLRPFGGYADDHFPVPDLRAYKLIGAEATKRTGYPAISIFHDFKYEPKQSITGSTTDWFYDYIGVYSWTTEFWSPQRQAGIEDYGFIEWMKEHPVEDDLKLLRWNDEKLDGKAYVDWYEFDHPQLGAVELGGWDVMNAWANVPPQFLEAEIAPHSDWALWHLLISPLLEIRSLDVDAVGKGRYKVQLVLQNTGWLPTQVTQKAIERKAVRPVEVELTLPEDAELVVGERRVEAGQLEGRVHKRSVLWWGGDDSTSDLTKLEWVIEAPQGGELGIEARHQRAGTVREVVSLGDSP